MAATAFLLAAGLGTRLRPLTEGRPKALVPMCGLPMLDWSLALLQRHGHQEIVVNAHHHADQIAAWAHSRGVQCVVEPEILGTGGGLRGARALLAARFVVLNADVLSDVDLTALLSRVGEGGAAMALRPHVDAAKAYGLVAADEQGVVVHLTDVARATPRGALLADTHFTGLHALDRSVLDRVPEGFACIVRTAYRELVPERRVTALRHTGTWIDVGDPTAYLAANLAVLTTRTPLPLDPTPLAACARTARGQHGPQPVGVELEGAAWIGHGARFGHDVRLEHVVIGAHAHVPSGTRLERCVVWDGCTVPAGDWHDCVFHDAGRLFVPSTA